MDIFLIQDDLPNLKCFSMNCYASIDRFNEKILSLFRRMLHLEKLSLYLCIENGNRFIDERYLQTEIIVYTPQLRSFTFYISTYVEFVNSVDYVSRQDLQQIIINHEHQCMATIINHIIDFQTICSIFSLPFAFNRLHDIGNVFPDTIFNNVTHLMVHDVVPFNHEFFIRMARSFPLLAHLQLVNLKPQSSHSRSTSPSDHIHTCSIIEYRHLISLDARLAHRNYLEQFLSERKSSVPRLTELTIVFNELRLVTNNFTRVELRNNCANLKRLFYMSSWVHTKQFYVFFPLL